jgi:uncharacterized protein (TIGR02466 family)
MGSLPLTEYFTVFPLLITKQDISGYAEQDDVIERVTADSEVYQHDLVTHASRSPMNNFLDSYPDLKNRMQSACDSYADKVGLERPTISQSWYVTYENTGTIKRHNHSGSVISGAYYPYIEKTRSSLVLENPTMVLRPTDPIISPTEYSTQAKAIPISPGTLLLFPSYMYHWTDPEPVGKRCVVSFNTQVIPKND